MFGSRPKALPGLFVGIFVCLFVFLFLTSLANLHKCIEFVEVFDKNC